MSDVDAGIRWAVTAKEAKAVNASSAGVHMVRGFEHKRPTSIEVSWKKEEVTPSTQLPGPEVWINMSYSERGRCCLN
jgi:hypothetical protein